MELKKLDKKVYFQCPMCSQTFVYDIDTSINGEFYCRKDYYIQMDKKKLKKTEKARENFLEFFRSAIAPRQ